MMRLPTLDADDFVATRDALHAYAGVLGVWLKACQPRRKHWWHASLRPSLAGLTTGVVHNGRFELELDLRGSALHGRTAAGDVLDIALTGQSAVSVAAELERFLLGVGVERRLAPIVEADSRSHQRYRPEISGDLADVIAFVAAAFATLRGGIREETSPIQLWPHHFDLSMLWLPGGKVDGEDVANEEVSDQQMNLGFAFGDASVPEPYFYTTAYPQPDGFEALPLPAGATHYSDGFDGVVLTYRTLQQMPDPEAYLLELWGQLLAGGRKLFADAG